MEEKKGFARRGMDLASSLGIVAFLVVLCGYFQATTSEPFLSNQNIWLILKQISINAIIAVGMTMVIITGGIDLSVGAVVALASVLSMAVMRHGFPLDYPFNDSIAGPVWPMGWAVLGAIAMTLVVGIAAGLHNGLPITKLRVPPFIATLVVMTAGRGFAYVYTEGYPIGSLPPAYTGLVMGTNWFLPVVAIVVSVMGFIVLRYTSFGRAVYAIGGNEQAARLSGINVNRIKLTVYVICGVLSAFAGMLLAGRLGAGDPKFGNMFELNAIAAVVIGGTSLSGGVGSIPGTFLGALVIGVLDFGLIAKNVPTFWQMVAKGYVILLAVVLDQLKARRR